MAWEQRGVQLVSSCLPPVLFVSAGDTSPRLLTDAFVERISTFLACMYIRAYAAAMFPSVTSMLPFSICTDFTSRSLVYSCSSTST
jgi:hypothetical protein